MAHTLMKQLSDLKLTGMVSALAIQMEQPGTYEDLSFKERLALLVSRESLERDQRKQKRLLQKARLRLEASVHDIDYQPARNLERSRIAQLSQSEWVLRGQNLLITGPCGCGKTYVGCALGNNACHQGYSVQYWRLSRLLGELIHGRADGSYRKQLSQLSKIQLLILDDWGLEPLQATQRNDLLELMDDRYGKSATIMISQLPTEEWYGCVGDNTLADAILDRLMHNAQRLEMKGESMRKRLAQVD
ncbi:ATP-binding protein [Salmonella enterica]|nr:ATP-binding protein [Salmonella enterica subsp. enterica serovar Newport]EGS7664494.1 ATP-binding protein [Salmonella enterica]EIT8744815.1 IS21-like element helper ATPase IstB [Salmonella enterica]